MDARLKESDGTFLEKTDVVLLASAVRAATNNTADQTNLNFRGVHVTVDVTVVPGVDTVTPKIQGKNGLTGVYYDILIGTAMVAVATQTLKVYPGLLAAANAVANDVLPKTWRVVLTHSAASNFTYSVGAQLHP
jgi:hypothetical protein